MVVVVVVVVVSLTRDSSVRATTDVSRPPSITLYGDADLG